MSTVAEVSTNGIASFFDPSQEQSRVRLSQGVYPAHIVKCVVKECPVKNKYKARIFNFTVKIDKDVANNTYKIEGIDGNLESVEGSNYIDREVRSQGIFYFLTPDVGDSFEAHAGGNRKYMETAEALGINCPEVEVEIDGKQRRVTSLPNLTKADFLGKPVLATLGLGKPWKGSDGVERQSFEVKSIDKWEKGEKIDVELEDLPF